MGLLKKVGKLAGTTAGKVVGGTLEIVGEATDNQTIKQVGQGVEKVASASGEVIGGLADATVVTSYGVVAQDGEKIKEGLGDAAASGEVALSAAASVAKGSVVGAVKLGHHIVQKHNQKKIQTELTTEQEL
jgi:hypothetical protein